MLETVGVFEVPKQNGKYETGQVGMCWVSSRFHGLFCFGIEPHLATVLNLSGIFFFIPHPLPHNAKYRCCIAELNPQASVCLHVWW